MPDLFGVGEWVALAVWLIALVAVVGWIIARGTGEASGTGVVARFMDRRTSWQQVTGLPLTMLLLLAGYFLTVYASGILGTAVPGRMVRADMYVASGLSALRTPGLIGFFEVVTAFGYWGVIFTLTAGASVLLWLRGWRNGLLGLWIAILGNQVTVTALKDLFRRARPDLAFFSEGSYSFPSGHSAISAAFFSILVYVLIRERILPTALAVLGGVLMIVLVGLSRVFLGEHYLSDVLSGNLVGFFWAFIGIWCMERFSKPHDRSLTTRWLQVAAVVVTAVALWFVVADYQHKLVILPPIAATADP